MTQDKVQFQPTTQERYDDMLGALPPAAYFSNGFLLGEPITHRTCSISGTYKPTYDAYVEYKGRFFVSCKPVTIAEAEQITVADFEVTKGGA